MRFIDRYATMQNKGIGGRMERVALLVNYNLYESKRHFTQKLAEAMERRGIETLIVDVNEGPLRVDAVREIQGFAPDLTCSFNTLLPLSEEKYLWDFLSIPHLSMLVDPLMYGMDLTKSPYSILSVVDRNDINEAVIPTFKNLFFFPHAVEKELSFDEKAERPFDVVFLGSCYDYESLRASWQQRNPEGLNKVLNDAIDIVFSDNRSSLANALAQAWGHSGLDPRGVDFVSLFYYLDNYTRGRDRIELIRSIKNVPVHIFGELSTDNAVGFLGWQPYLAGNSNVTIHPSVPFAEGLEIQKKAKICLNSMPFFRDGTHERVFTALACGAVPVTSESVYLRESFADGQDLVYYQSNEWNRVEPTILSLLKDEPRRRAIAASGRQKVMAAHTWDHRVSLLEKELPPILARIEGSDV